MSAISQDEVAQLLRGAVAAVDAAGVEPEFRQESFRWALALMSGTDGGVIGGPDSLARGQTMLAPESMNGPRSAQSSANNSGLASDDPLDFVADFLDCDQAGVHRIYAVQDGIPELKIKTTKLPTAKGPAAVDIALLVMAARQGARIEEYTVVGDLQSVTKAYGKFDTNNYASSVRQLDHLVLKRGRGVKLERKLTKPGIEAAAKLVSAYASEAT